MEQNKYKKGGWVAQGDRIGRIIDVHDYDGELLIDVVLYAPTGEKIGRESESLDGPKGFEPCCGADGWKPIEKPDFPLKNYFYPRDKFIYL